MSVLRRESTSIKAYALGGAIVVKYFDCGNGNELFCPNCQWYVDYKDLAINDSLKSTSIASDLRCPDCETKLGSITQVVND